MARTHSGKRRLLGFVNPSTSSPRRFENRAGDFASIPETLSVASPGIIARMKRFFRGSNEGPSTTIVTQIVDTDGRAQDQQEQSQAPADPDVAAASTGVDVQEQQNKLQAVPTTDVERSIPKREPDPKSIVRSSDNASQKWFVKRVFPCLRRTQPNLTGTGEGAQEHPQELQATRNRENRNLTDKLEPSPVPISAWKNVDPAVVKPPDHIENVLNTASSTPAPGSIGVLDAAQQALDGRTLIPRIGQVAVGYVSQIDAAAVTLQSFNDTYLQSLKTFNSVVTQIAKVHPYAQIALGILTAVSQLLINQANLDVAVSGLFITVRKVYEFLAEDDTIHNIEPMKETLGKIADVISDVAKFIRRYSETKNFWSRLGKNILAETQAVIDSYTGTLNDLMQQYRDREVRDIRNTSRRVLEGLDDLNIEGMAYAAGAGLNRTKKCLEGTRTEILTDIVNWIQDAGENPPRILWLYGQAGRGKSAIAHTISMWFKNAGGPGSCFCFARDRLIEHREEKIFATIAHDLAGRDPAFRLALADVITKDPSLKTTSDVTLQWEKLILEPWLKVSPTMIGSVVVVIDALDESGPELSRKHILSVLSTQGAGLPRNFRVLVTSRALPDIKYAFSTARHVKMTSLDDVFAKWTERDIRLYVLNELRHLPDIGETEVQKISQKADCLFEWARLACDFIKPSTPGATVKERYDDLIALRSEEGRTLLDATYTTILYYAIPRSGRTLERYRSVMHDVLTVLEPLPIKALNHLRQHFPNERDRYDIAVILEFMGPVLGGIVDHSSPVRPLHSSFYEYLTERSRSRDFFVDTSGSYDLAFATLQILCNELRFNICELESSYLSNAEVSDLPKRITKHIPTYLSYACQFWAQHLQRTSFDSKIARQVKNVIGTVKVLFWLEVMSLLGAVGQAADSLAWVALWLLDQDDCSGTLALAEDGIKFIHNFSSAISHSAPHLYISALPFIPPSTVLSRLLMPRFFGLAMVAAGGLKRWPVAQLTLDGHTDSVYAVAFSPDGRKIVSGSKDRTVRIWDAERGLETGSPLEGHTSAVFSVAFSPDGKKIVSGSRDKTLRIWGADGGGSIGNPLVGHTDAVESTAFSHDGKQIISGSRDKTVRVWDAERGMIIGSPIGEHNSAVFSVAFSPDGRRFVSGLEDGTVMVRDVMGNMLFSGPIGHHAGAVKSVAFSPDGKKIVSGSLDKTVRIWDAERGGPIGSPIDGHSSAVFSVAFSPSGKRIISGSWDSTVIVWDTEAGVLVDSPLQGHTNAVNSVAFSHDGKRIISGSGDRTIRIWDAERGGQNGSSPQGHTQVKAVAPSSGYEGIVPVPHDHHVISVHEESEVLACNTSSALVPSYATDIVKRCFICFSSKSSHVLHDSEQLLDGLQLEDDNVRDEPVKLQDDGWIRGPKGRLLLWIHPTLRRPFYSMWNGVTISRGGCVELDLSQMVHGNKWHMCFKEIV